jgi:transcriptional regulator with GAF, ATPase, and Fis domain
MDLSPVILAMAQAEGPPSVLGQIVGALLRQESVALARVWFLDDDACPVCPSKRLDERDGALHLRASGGRPLDPGADWSRIDGRFHRIPLQGSLKVARIAVTGEPLLIPDLSQDQDWGVDRDWVRRESLRGFVGHPLRFRDKVVGVLACFLRTGPDESTLEWLRVFAAHAAVAVGNCRAFQEIDRLRARLEMERDYLLEESGHRGAFEEILGESPALERVLRQLEMVAPTDANVLILGESGTGKELIARAIHQRSARADRTLVKVNCGSIPKELFESEFFGHVKGAFTGAVRDRVGRFQLADHGTLFLDEVAEIPLDLQAKLLRVLQGGEFERVGEETTRHVTVRILAATNRDLRAEVDAGRFRLDLFYRLGVFPLQVPALRDRREDIPILAADFVRRACQRQHRPMPKVPRGEIAKLMEYDWPGNIRELQNVVERAVILTRRGPIRFPLSDAAVSAKGREEKAPEPSRGYYTEEEWRRMERENILAALRKAEGRVAGPSGAAALLGVNANTLASRLRALGIRKSYSD